MEGKWKAVSYVSYDGNNHTWRNRYDISCSLPFTARHGSNVETLTDLPDAILYGRNAHRFAWKFRIRSQSLHPSQARLSLSDIPPEKGIAGQHSSQNKLLKSKLLATGLAVSKLPTEVVSSRQSPPLVPGSPTQETYTETLNWLPQGRKEGTARLPQHRLWFPAPWL